MLQKTKQTSVKETRPLIGVLRGQLKKQLICFKINAES